MAYGTEAPGTEAPGTEAPGTEDAAVTLVDERLAAARSFSEVKAVEATCLDVMRAFPDSKALALRYGMILRRKLHWDHASLYFAQQGILHAHATEFFYEAALSAIDAGTYGRGRELIECLGQILDRLDDRQLRGMWRAAPQVMHHEISVRAFALRAGAGVAPAIARATETRLQRAIEIFNGPVPRRVSFMSLGENCFPWMVLNRWGLRRPEATYVQQSPFNLAQTTTDGIATLLERGLPHLLDRDLVQATTDNEGVRPVNPTFNFDFNHERGEYYVDGGFARLIDRYLSKIDSFAAKCESGPTVWVHYTERDGDLVKLSEAVAAMMKHPRYRLVIVDVAPERRPVGTLPPFVRYMKATKPYGDYLWFRPDDWDCETGVAFESSIVQFALDAAAELTTPV